MDSMTHRTPHWLRTPVLAGAAFAIAASSLLAACGGGGGDDDEDSGSNNDRNNSSSDALELEEWVNEVCDLAADFEDRVADVDAGFDEIDPEGDDAPDEFIALVEEGDELSEERFEEFLDIGEPDIRGGDDVIAEFEAHQEANQDAIDELLEILEGLDAGPDFEDDLFAALADLPRDSLRDRLEDLAADEDEVQDLLDLIDEDTDCANSLFDEAGEGQAATSTATSARTPSRLPTQQTTPAANATDNEEWVIGFCTAFATWGEDIAVISERSTEDSDIESAKGAIVSLMEESAARSRMFAFELEDLGAPDVKDGARIQQTLTSMGNSSVAVFDRATRQARALPTNNATTFQAEAEKVLAEFEAAFNEVVAGLDEFDKYDTAELDAIFERVPECDALR
ncbi:MAG: hypothetical protein IT303_19380 [Dehalococcoidia bacterium]|nr:hypothetical protein [Dehalococcoidia bacterium]